MEEAAAEAEGFSRGGVCGVSVSDFDYSVDNHFKAMDTISKLCGETAADDTLDQSEINRFSSSITFLREWRNYNYKPRVVRFASQIESGEENDVSLEITLPQFSSASVPKTEELCGNSTASVESSKDFVMYVGGSVWALDWCPRDHERLNSDIKCEFVAVAAHPPESYHHKMGAVLTGRGFVQIWCILNYNGNTEEILPAVKRRKGRAGYNRGDKSVEPKKPIGRPRKKQTEDSPNGKAKQGVTQKRPRGRPRKKPISEPFDSLDLSSQDIQALAVEYPEEPLALIAVEGDPKNSGEECTQKSKGKKRKSSSEAASASFSADKSAMSSAKLKRNAKQTGDPVDGASPHLLTQNEEAPISATTTNVRGRKLRSKRKKSSNSDDAAYPTLLTQNEEASTSNRQLPVNSGQDPALVNCVSADISLETNSASIVIPKNVALPKVVFCLAHNGKVAWDVKWRPHEGSNSRCSYRMGYLAVLLGNGSLEVWDIPLPQTMKIVYSSSHKEGTDPRFIKLEPVFKCSNLKCGEKQSIPLTVEWSTSRFQDYLLAGFHDGMVALWKFSASDTSRDTKPLLCFSADTKPIRAVAWAPVESEQEQESTNIIMTAGQLNIKFWDIRDPFRPLWDIHAAPKFVYSADWVSNPRCIIFSCDDGTMKLFSLVKAAYESPFNGKSFAGTKIRSHTFNGSSFAVWSVQVSSLTGMVAYCGADGAVRRFQLTAKAVEKDSYRERAPHFICGSLGEDESIITIFTPLPGIPLNTKKPIKDTPDNARSMQGITSKPNQSKRTEAKSKVSDSENQILALRYGDDPGAESGGDKETIASIVSKSKRKSNKSNKEKCGEDHQALVVCRDEKDDQENSWDKENGRREVEIMPPKTVAMHKVRWNVNKGSERWLCSGGAAGIVRCQEIKMTDIDWHFACKR